MPGGAITGSGFVRYDLPGSGRCARPVARCGLLQRRSAMLIVADSSTRASWQFGNQQHVSVATCCCGISGNLRARTQSDVI